MITNNMLFVIFALIFSLSVPCPAQNSAPTDLRSKYPPLGRLVDVGGYRVHIYCTGQGSPTVMIVGNQPTMDWGLVQPEVAKSTQVCTYDYAGVAWSDPGPEPTCDGRTAEIHNLMKNAGIKGPVIIVGHSIGAAFARLYTNRYPDDVLGIVIIDHAAFFPAPPGTPRTLPPPTTRVAPPQANFSRLPAYNLELHNWVASLPPTVTQAKQRAFYDECREEANKLTASRPYLNGNMPLVVIHSRSSFTDNLPESSKQQDAKLQASLVALSHNSKLMIAENSSHIVQVDRPDVIVSGINQVVEAVRHKSKLKSNSP